MIATGRRHNGYPRSIGSDAYGVTEWKFTRTMGGKLVGFDVIYDGALRETIVYVYVGNGMYAEPNHVFRLNGYSFEDTRRMVLGR